MEQTKQHQQKQTTTPKYSFGGMFSLSNKIILVFKKKKKKTLCLCMMRMRESKKHQNHIYVFSDRVANFIVEEGEANLMCDDDVHGINNALILV